MPNINVTNKNTLFRTDSKTIILALNTSKFTTTLLLEAHVMLSNISKAHNIILACTKGHEDNTGNSIADELAGGCAHGSYGLEAFTPLPLHSRIANKYSKPRTSCAPVATSHWWSKVPQRVF